MLCGKKSIGNGGQSRYFASTTLSPSTVSIIIPVAVINGRPRTVFTLTWGLVATTKEAVLPFFGEMWQVKLECHQ